ncbi:interferon a3-like [Pangasianodon hypophthalmus]|uniref:interferon a3-like n=1 Tax=Pangasianodon hypophthalmus TaxID=310915 RepID=UPI002307F5D4|nr:interferon a3-like [Pangasianodon hypophthalmus]
MFLRLVHLCVILTLCSVSSGFSCRWINLRFKQHHATCLALLREMGEEISVNASIPDNWHHWFFNQSYSQPEKQIWFIVQTLDEVSRLLEDSDSVSWNKDKLETFLHMLDLQANGLRSCLEHKMKKSKRLPLYFKQLRDFTKNDKQEKNVAWEWIRKELLQLFGLLDFFPAVSVNRAENDN